MAAAQRASTPTPTPEPSRALEPSAVPCEDARDRSRSGNEHRCRRRRSPSKVHDPGVCCTPPSRRAESHVGARVRSRRADATSTRSSRSSTPPSARRAASRAARSARSTARPAHGVYLNTDVLRLAGPRLRARRAALPPATSRRTRSPTTCRSCPARCGASRPPTTPTRAAPTGARSRPSCRPTATRACGCTRCRRRASCREADLNDILKAAAVVGDDFQRNQAGAELAPETWTHGSSAQRVQWVTTGLREGRPAACDTFSGG